MRCTLALVFLSALQVAPAQTYAVGTTDVDWTNLTGVGTPVLAARVHYPAVTAGTNAPVLPQVGGWPVVVFLHGYSMLGSAYASLGDAWARAGFVVVLSDTAQWDFVAQEHDGRALYSAVIDANSQPGVFHGALDVQRLALAGHSMGGGITGAVLANNPGYLCGIALAPVFPGIAVANQVIVPFGILAGTGDVITPWYLFSQPYFDAVGSQDGLKFLYLLNGDCNHMNVAGLSTQPTPLVFDRIADIGVGFLRHFLGVDIAGLEKVVGPEAQAEPRLVSLSQQVTTPQIWAESPLRISGRTRLSVAAEEGLGGVLAALSMGPGVFTSIGLLMLDPATAFTLAIGYTEPNTGRIDALIELPNMTALIGLPVALQAVGVASNNPLLLGSAIMLTVQP